MSLPTKFDRLTTREIELALRDIQKETRKARSLSRDYAEKAESLDNAGIVLAKLLEDRKIGRR